MRTLLALFSLSSFVAFAQADDCASLRRALALAQQAGVNSGDLWRLEQQRCQAPSPGVRGDACVQLDAMLMLSQALSLDGEVPPGLEAQRGVWCGRGDEPARVLQWPSGATLRTSSGALYWPNGALARSVTGAWYAPSGTLVKSATGMLSYPNGGLMRTTTGRTSLPSGEQADEGRLAALACQQNLGWCRYFLGEARGTGDRRDFALLGLGLLAGRAD